MINSNGLHLIDICKSFDLSIINGRFGDDKEIGDYTGGQLIGALASSCHYIRTKDLSMTQTIIEVIPCLVV